jgi:hypothetical protein
MAYLTGGFFGFVKRAFKKVAHIVGKVGGTALGVASIVVPGPAGRLVNAVGGRLAGARSAYAKAGSTLTYLNQRANMVPGLLSKQSIVMPGGSLAMRPVSLGKRRASSAPRKKRRGPKRRAAARGRKLKFGSPAWRKKYMHKRRAAR